MKQDQPAIEHPNTGEPFWLDGPQIDASFVVLASIMTLFLSGAWFWVWSISDAQRAAVVLGTAIGMLISLLWCGIRIQRFDLRTWQWRNAAQPRSYGRATGLIIGLASGAGALTAGYLTRVTGQDFQFGLMAGIFICCGTICLWCAIEGSRHLWYYRHRKRAKRR